MGLTVLENLTILFKKISSVSVVLIILFIITSLLFLIVKKSSCNSNFCEKKNKHKQNMRSISDELIEIERLNPTSNNLYKSNGCVKSIVSRL